MYRFSPRTIKLILGGFSGGLLVGTLGTVVGASLGSDIFDDVREGSYYDEAIGELYQDGIIKGYDARHFGPDDFVTRGQVAVMLQRFRDDLESSSSSRSSASRSSSSTSSSTSSSSSSSSRSRQSSSFIAARGIVRFTTASYTVDENADTAQLTLIRYGGNDGDVEVSYTITGQSASAGTDFNGTTGKVTFEDEQTSKTLSVDLLDDSTAESNETFSVYIDSVTNRAGIGSPDTATVVIRDNESSNSSNSSSSSGTNSSSNSAGTISIGAAGYTVKEAAGTVTITVVREGSTSAAAGVSYATSNGTATTGSDYSSTNGTLAFAIGEASKSFTIPIYDDDAVDGNKNFTLTLSSPTGGAVLGTTKTVTVTVFDDEGSTFGSGSLRLSKSTYNFTEGSGYADIVIQRVGGAQGSITVEYAAINATAYSGADFAATSGTLTFAAHESSKLIRIALVKDSVSESDDYFRFHLSNPSSTTNLIEPYQAVVNIEN